MLTPLPLSAPAARALLARRQESRPDVVDAVRQIIHDVQARGDAALREATTRFDGVDLADPWLPAKEWDAAARSVPAVLRLAIDRNLARIKAFHRLQRRGPDTVTVAPGVRLGRRPVPFTAVACYVPGGRASYPSTACMTVVPAAIAGVQDIVVVTPPRPDGSVDAVVCYAAKKAGATRILRAGGAQAVAAVASGTKSIPQVDAIVGPGNAYVTEAKRQVHGQVWTDAPAGPSELLIVADKAASPAEVALDLMAQAEHDPDAQVLLVTTSAPLALAVRAQILRRLPAAHRRDIIEASLRDHGALLVAPSLATALAFSDEYAPEHLTLMVQEPRAAFAKIRNAGSVFLGRHAPVSLGDYGSGTNHVLPTMGQARIRGGLSVEDFRKWISWQEVTAAGLAGIGRDVALVARAEGLVAHAQAVEERLGWSRIASAPARPAARRKRAPAARRKQ